MVGGDVVLHLQKHFASHALRQRHWLIGKGLMLGPRSDFHLSAPSSGAGGTTMLSLIRKCSGISISSRSFAAECVGSVKHAGQGGGRRRLRAHQIDLRVARCRCGHQKLRLNVRRETPFGAGGLAHADAGPAGAFQDSGARRDHVRQRAVFRQHVEHLLGARSDGQADVGMAPSCP